MFSVEIEIETWECINDVALNVKANEDSCLHIFESRQRVPGLRLFSLIVFKDLSHWLAVSTGKL